MILKKLSSRSGSNLEVLTSDTVSAEDRHHGLEDPMSGVSTVHLVEDLDEVLVHIFGSDEILVVQQVLSPLLLEETPDVFNRIEDAGASWQEVLDHAERLHPLLDQFGAMGRVVIGHQHMTFHIEIGEGVT